MKLIKFNMIDLTSIKNKISLRFLKNMVFVLLFLTIFINISPVIYGQQIYAGGGYYYTPLNLLMQSSETTLSLNSYYEASIKALIEINKSWILGFSLFRNTFDYLNPNGLSLDLTYSSQIFNFTQSLILKNSDNFISPFIFAQLQTNIELDFYPEFFVSTSFSFPFYYQNFFSAIPAVPNDLTFEKKSLGAEAGLYIYQLCLGLSFHYENLIYNFDLTSDIVYNEYNLYDYIFFVRLIPTFTAFGFELKIGYKDASILFSDDTLIYHRFIYADCRLIFRIGIFTIEPSFGYILYSFFSPQITNFSSLVKLNANLYLSVKF